MTTPTHSANDWAEELPPNCPPATATAPQYEVFYRLAKQFPPTPEDFYSHRKLYPQKTFHTTECRARSLSIFSNFEECRKLLKLPLHRQKKMLELILPPESGVILQTGTQLTHYSWWKTAKYNPLLDCQEVTHYATTPTTPRNFD
jgi:hypothetical protein